jgi:shikimate kinase
MGSGKSAVGRRLAAQLGLEFVDSDAEIESRTGVDIPYIFEREGVLVATGGGAILDPENRRWLRSRGCVVYLRASVGQQLARTRRGDQRPLLRNPDPRGTLERLMEQRAPLYEEVADLTVDTDGRRVAAVVEEIAGQLAAARGA